MCQVVVISQPAVLSQQFYGVTKDNHTIYKHLEQSVSKLQYKPNLWIQSVHVHKTMLSAVQTVNCAAQQLC
jgi:hypothetical protein